METGLQVTILVIGIAIIVILKKKPEWGGKVVGALGSATPEEKKNMILVGGTLVILNLLILGMIPWFWDVLTYQWYVPILFNLGLGAFLYLRKADGKKLASLVGGALVVGLLTTAYYKVAPKFGFGSENRGIVSRTRLTGVDNYSHGVPAEIALPIIADFESGDGTPGSARQFLADGKTPVRNPQNAGPGKGAVGEWQINLSDPAVVEELKLLEADMKKDGRLKKDERLDVEFNREHNYEAAKYLYSKYKTNPWNASKGGWEPKLRHFTWGGGEAVSIVVIAPTDKWSNEIPAPYAPRRWEIEGFGKKYTVLWNGKTEEDFPQKKRVEKDQEIIYNFRLRSKEAKPLNLVVKFF